MASPLAPNRPVVKLKRAKGKAAPKRPKPSPKNTVSANPAKLGPVNVWPRGYPGSP